MATGLDNLRIYKQSQKLETNIHRLTEKFPIDEKYRMIDQMRRSSASVVNNIAEGYGKYNFGQKIYSLQIARGEAYEIRSQITSAAGKKYLEQDIAKTLSIEYTILIKGISAYINFLKNRQST